MKLIQGNEACALGAMQAGCRFFAGYPITPATEIMEWMARLLPPPQQAPDPRHRNQGHTQQRAQQGLDHEPGAHRRDVAV